MNAPTLLAMKIKRAGPRRKWTALAVGMLALLVLVVTPSPPGWLFWVLLGVMFVSLVASF